MIREGEFIWLPGANREPYQRAREIILPQSQTSSKRGMKFLVFFLFQVPGRES